MGSICCNNRGSFEPSHLFLDQCETFSDLKFIVKYNIYKIKDKLTNLSSTDIDRDSLTRKYTTNKNTPEIKDFYYFIRLEMVLIKIDNCLEYIFDCFNEDKTLHKYLENERLRTESDETHFDCDYEMLRRLYRKEFNFENTQFDEQNYLKRTLLIVKSVFETLELKDEEKLLKLEKKIETEIYIV